MSKPLIAGNWKMNTNAASAVALARGVGAASADLKGVDLLICPPSIYLRAVTEAVAGTLVAVGGQNMHHKASGAFTGEISAPMLLDSGASFVILGHSERRNVFGESNADVNAKVLAAVDSGLTPIVCVGELLAQRELGDTGAVIRDQLEGSLDGVSSEHMESIVLAYEPVWAIGTGKVATPDQAEEVHADLRKLLAERYNEKTSVETRILYGGSVKPSNAAKLLSQPNINGALVGGASLKVADFLGIAQAAKSEIP